MFGRKITATDIRKLITTKMRDQPAHLQSAVALAEGHSVQVAHNCYNISHPHETVQNARSALLEIATQGIYQRIRVFIVSRSSQPGSTYQYGN